MAGIDYQKVIGRAVATINARLAEVRVQAELPGHQGDAFSVAFLLDQLELCREWLRKYASSNN